MTRDELKKSYRNANLPPYMMEGIIEYVMIGREPGGFLTSLLSNDLVGTYQKADPENTRFLREWIKWMWLAIPSVCWGSRKEVRKWREKGGIEGFLGADFCHCGSEYCE